jgi:hypothetical protein
MLVTLAAGLHRYRYVGPVGGGTLAGLWISRRIWQARCMTKNHPLRPEREITLRELYPNLSDVQLEEADENLRQYVALVLRVLERLKLDPDAWTHFEALTASRRESRMNHERPSDHSSQS